MGIGGPSQCSPGYVGGVLNTTFVNDFDDDDALIYTNLGNCKKISELVCGEAVNYLTNISIDSETDSVIITNSASPKPYPHNDVNISLDSEPDSCIISTSSGPEEESDTFVA